MRYVFRWLAVAAMLCVPAGAATAGWNQIHLVPALKECKANAPCPRELESSYRFDSIVLFTPTGRYLPRGKPSLALRVRGVRDASGALVNGELRLKVLPGRVSVPPFGTFPDGSSVIQQPPVAIPLKNGNNPKVTYRPAVETPDGTIVNGGGVEVYDPGGKLLAVTGSQTKP